ncbi:MAG: ribosome silencing factor [Flavobacteriales bacterium]|nr:ribosome silencing factor [Bacteroidota bacterium]MCB9240498.1 ribosome silencing factor [Flavobacteriales bacterium]
MPNKPASPDKLAEIVVQGMLEKKARNVVVIDLRELGAAVTDIMVISHGDSDRQVEAIAESVVDEVKKQAGENPFSREGQREGNWVIVDYITVVAHVFKKDMRGFYAIEDLWADGKVTVITED